MSNEDRTSNESRSKEKCCDTSSCGPQCIAEMMARCCGKVTGMKSQEMSAVMARCCENMSGADDCRSMMREMMQRMCGGSAKQSKKQ